MQHTQHTPPHTRKSSIKHTTTCNTTMLHRRYGGVWVTSCDILDRTSSCRRCWYFLFCLEMDSVVLGRWNTIIWMCSRSGSYARAQPTRIWSSSPPPIPVACCCCYFAIRVVSMDSTGRFIGVCGLCCVGLVSSAWASSQSSENGGGMGGGGFWHHAASFLLRVATFVSSCAIAGSTPGISLVICS
jgi:hypothetical protein